MPSGTSNQQRSSGGISRLCRRCALLVGMTFLSGCSLFGSDSKPSGNEATAGMQFDSVILQRLGCVSGGCPAYRLQIDLDGNVHYRGDANVAVHGKQTAQADPAALRQLRRLLQDPDLIWLKDRYTPGHSDCGAWSMNDGAVTLDIQAARLSKHIDHYLGCHGAPALLNRIEEAIDRAAAVGRWTTAR